LLDFSPTTIVSTTQWTTILPSLQVFFIQSMSLRMGPFPAAETVKPESGAFSQDFLCIDNATTDCAMSPAPSLSSDDTLIDQLSPPESLQLLTPLQSKLPEQNVEIRLDDLLDWNGEQTFAADSKQIEFLNLP
jgi:hypothetical protein